MAEKLREYHCNWCGKKFPIKISKIRKDKELKCHYCWNKLDNEKVELEATIQVLGVKRD